jgi:hypothetical protein
MGRCPIPRKKSGLLDLGTRPIHANFRMVWPHRSLIKNIKDPARGEAAGGGLGPPGRPAPPGAPQGPAAHPGQGVDPRGGVTKGA